MNKWRLCFCCLSICALTQAQTKKIETDISSTRIFDLSVIRIYPDSFPKISVVFQAKNKLGKPLWLLKKEELKIIENNKECQILELKELSKNKSLNIAMVLDHSGSMVDNPAQMPDSVETYQDLYFMKALPKDYIMPIDYAKKAVFDFCNITETSDDSLLLIGFSTQVDSITSLTNDFKSVQERIKAIEPVGGTAFYDALYKAIDSLKNHASQPVIIALTDGDDNRSLHTMDELVKYAKENNVIIYVIGLGRAQSKRLEYITQSTKGFYYYTNDPASLSEIYSNIKQQIKSIYQVDYVSKTDEINDQNIQNIEFVFKNDTLSFSSNSAEYELPEQVVKYLKEQDKIRTGQKQLLIYGGVAVMILISVFTFVVIRNRRKKSTELMSVFPNPFTDNLSIEYILQPDITKAILNIQDKNGVIVSQQTIPLLTSKAEFNLSELKKGMYILQIEVDSYKSNSMKAIKE